MLVVPLGQVVFARRVAPSQDFVNVVQARYAGTFLHRPDLNLYLTAVWQIHGFGGSKNAVFVNGMNHLSHGALLGYSKDVKSSTC
jgi:hypothetical protein